MRREFKALKKGARLLCVNNQEIFVTPLEKNKIYYLDRCIVRHDGTIRLLYLRDHSSTYNIGRFKIVKKLKLG